MKTGKRDQGAQWHSKWIAMKEQATCHVWRSIKDSFSPRGIAACLLAILSSDNNRCALSQVHNWEGTGGPPFIWKHLETLLWSMNSRAPGCSFETLGTWLNLREFKSASGASHIGHKVNLWLQANNLSYYRTCPWNTDFASCGPKQKIHVT